MISILSAVLIYGKSGVIGIKLTEILGGLIGDNKIYITNRNICSSNKNSM